VSKQRTPPRTVLYAACFIALLLSALPLPRVVGFLRPDFLLLTVIWFALAAPRAGGLSFAFLIGLLLDAFQGVVLGERAFGFVAIAYLVHRFHLRIRMFPLGHQTLTVMSLLFFFQFILFWIDGVTGHPVTDWERWMPVLTGTLIWPVLAAVLGRFVARG
jgi:rod shape-determining protein MreD